MSNKPKLTNAQRDGVIEQFVELVVDGMDTKDLVRYVSEQLTEYYEDCSDIELKEFVDNYDEELFDELVDNVTHKQDANNPTFHMDQAFAKAHKEI